MGKKSRTWDGFWSAIESYVMGATMQGKTLSMQRARNFWDDLADEQKRDAVEALRYKKQNNSQYPSAYTEIWVALSGYDPEPFKDPELQTGLPTLTHPADFPPGERYRITLTKVNTSWHYVVDNHKGHAIAADNQPTASAAVVASSQAMFADINSHTTPPRKVYNFVLYDPAGQIIGKSHAVDIDDPQTMMSNVIKYLGKRYNEGPGQEIIEAGAGLKFREFDAANDEEGAIIHAIEIEQDTVQFDNTFNEYIWPAESSTRRQVFQFTLL
jgi:hypothetical protein